MNLSPLDHASKFQSAHSTTFSAVGPKKDLPIYRIIKLPDENDQRIYFQVIGKAIVLRKLPEALMRDDLLLGFGKADIILITHLGTKNETKANNAEHQPGKFFKILKQIFRKGKTLFVIEKESGEIVNCEPQEIYSDDSMAERFSGKDAMKIGYSAAEEHYQKISHYSSSDEGEPK